LHNGNGQDKGKIKIKSGGGKNEKAELELHKHIVEEYEQTKKTEPVKMKSKKDLQKEIARLEHDLEKEKQEIIDDLSFAHFFGRLLPRALRIKLRLEKKLTPDDYFRHIARKHIRRRDERTLVDKIKEFIET
jgi:hypothetical protein